MDTLMRMQASYDIARPASVKSKSTYGGFSNWPTFRRDESTRDESKMGSVDPSIDPAFLHSFPPSHRPSVH